MTLRSTFASRREASGLLAVVEPAEMAGLGEGDVLPVLGGEPAPEDGVGVQVDVRLDGGEVPEDVAEKKWGRNK